MTGTNPPLSVPVFVPSVTRLPVFGFTYWQLPSWMAMAVGTLPEEFSQERIAVVHLSRFRRQQVRAAEAGRGNWRASIFDPNLIPL
jgi:hypothetical protein